MPSAPIQPSTPLRRGARRRRRPLRWVGLTFLTVFVVLMAAIAWSAWRAWPAARDARTQLSALQSAAATLHGMPTMANVAALDAHLVPLLDDLRFLHGTWTFWRGPILVLSQVSPHLHALAIQIDPLFDYALSVTQAGHLLLETASPLLTATQTKGVTATGPLLVTDLEAAHASLDQAGSLLTDALQARQHIDTTNLPSSAQAAFRRLDPLLPQAPNLVASLAALPTILGAHGPRDYLVVPENSEDLRASGGFIRTVGVLHVDHGHISLINLADAYSIDSGQGRRPNALPPLPMEIYGWGGWYFRDANWSADFPTTARLLEIFYKLGTGRSVNGVIAFDSLFLPQLLDLTGPVEVPGYHETLTASNAFQRIDYYLNYVETSTSRGVGFATAAYKATFTHLESLPVSRLRDALSAFHAAAQARDLLLYADDPSAEAAIQRIGADAAINRTTHDYLYVVDTNMSTNKINQRVRQAIAYREVIQPDRTILATLTITYSNQATAENVPRQDGQPTYSDFVRVFVPLGSVLLGSSGLDQPWRTYIVHFKTQFSGYFTLPSLATRVVTMRYHIPASAAEGSRYALLVQKQPGTGPIPLTLDVSTMPDIQLQGSPIHDQLALAQDVTATAMLVGGRPSSVQVFPSTSEPPVLPGSHPEVWVTVPTHTVPGPVIR